MTNQGYRFTAAGIMVIATWVIIVGVTSTTFNPFTVLPIIGMVFCFVGWFLQSSMFSKLSPEQQIRIGYAIAEDFINENGILKEQSK